MLRSLRLPTLLLLVFALFPACCLAAKAEKGPLQPDATSAVLNADAEHYTAIIERVKGIIIIEMDGKHLGKGLLVTKYPTSIRMTPGRHTFRLGYEDAFWHAFAILWLDAEAGKAYAAHAEKVGDSHMNIWITEADTGRVVGGIEGSEPPPGDVPAAASADAAATLPVADATSALLVVHPGQPNGGLLADPKERLKVIDLDGAKQTHMGTRDQVLQMAPGRHELVLQYRTEGGSAYAVRTLAFAVEAGHTYVLRKQLDGYAVRFWIEDPASGQVMSEEK